MTSEERFLADATSIPEGFRDDWTAVRGLRIHALESIHALEPAGAASPAVVLLPGLVTASRSMVPLARALTARGIQVKVLDPPGFGYSDKPPRSLSIAEQARLVAEWLTATDSAPARLLGNSFGAQVAAAVAARHPGTVARLVLLSPTLSPAAARWLKWLRVLPRREAPASWRPRACWRARLLARLHRVLGDQPSLRTLNVAEYCCASLPRAIGTLRSAVLTPIERELPRITAPVLIIRAEHDHLSSPGWTDRLAGLLPAGRVAGLSGAGHDVFSREPDAVADAVAPFLVSETGSQVVTAR